MVKQLSTTPAEPSADGCACIDAVYLAIACWHGALRLEESDEHVLHWGDALQTYISSVPIVEKLLAAMRPHRLKCPSRSPR